MQEIEKFKSRQELANKFVVDRKTFRLKLVKFKIKIPNGLIYPADQKMIYG
tara:strand:+ start:3785 stop:3937 length:153 start_codon:yes stop_codon:yes gene_type:complete